jgi:aspartyl aminopeptidase
MSQSSFQEDSLIEDLIRYIEASPSAWHAVDVTAERLRSLGFIELDERAVWQIKPETAYFTTRNGSSLCAFVTPTQLDRARILASHTDSPALKVKPSPFRHAVGCLTLATEVYGGPILPSWFNRELSLAGRVFVSTSKGPEQRLVHYKEPVASIAHLAIHLDNTLGNEHKVKRQEHLPAITEIVVEKEEKEAEAFERGLKDAVGIDVEILAHVLFLIPTESPAVFGKSKQLLDGYRLDNLLAAHGNLEAFCAARAPSHNSLKMWISWDNEEVGSETAQGAGSGFLSDTLERLFAAYELSIDQQVAFKQRSHLLSNDASHAVHPNFKDKHESVGAPQLGLGPIVKLNAQQRYASDAESEAAFAEIAKRHAIPFQRYVSRNDVRCGSTIGPIASTRLGIKTLDMGSGLLSMHSARELAASVDHLYLVQLMHAWLEEV